jgi:hypothetical protein
MAATRLLEPERQGFEPWGPEGPTVFETAPFDHSGTSPRNNIGKFDNIRQAHYGRQAIAARPGFRAFEPKARKGNPIGPVMAGHRQAITGNAWRIIEFRPGYPPGTGTKCPQSDFHATSGRVAEPRPGD